MPRTSHSRQGTPALSPDGAAAQASLFESALLPSAPAAVPPSAEGAPARPPRFLLEGETRLDATTAQLVAQLSGLRWPRKWSAIRRFDLLAAEEVERLLGLEESGGAKGLLSRRTRGGASVVELSARGEEALSAREGGRGYRRVLKEPSGAVREYFIKRIETSDGFIETRLSWFGAAWPLFEEAGAKMETSFRAFLARTQGEQKSLFEELDEAERERADGQLRLMESIRDGRVVLDYLLRTFGRDGNNPVRVAAWDLRALLRAENDPHGLRRVRGCLSALSEIRFQTQLKGKEGQARSFGSLVAEVQYVGAGTGDHGDGYFVIHLAPSALGCLAVFGVEGSMAPPLPPRTIGPRIIAPASGEAGPADFDWKKTLSPMELARLRSGFVRSHLTLAPHYDRALDSSPTQAALMRWIERQLTQERDPARYKSTPITPGDRAYRLYTHLFCPLLPQGRSFLGALGHFRERPERGRKLASLAHDLGFVWPAPRAKAAHAAAIVELLADLQLVVADVLGGFIAVCMQTRDERGKPRDEWHDLAWLLEEPENTATRAANATFLLFISPDYRIILMENLERYYQERFESGEAPFPIKVLRADKMTPEELAQYAQSIVSPAQLAAQEQPLAARLKAERIRRRLSQSRLATELGVSQSMIAHWEKGDGTKTFSSDSVQKIMEWLAKEDG